MRHMVESRKLHLSSVESFNAVDPYKMRQHVQNFPDLSETESMFSFKDLVCTSLLKEGHFADDETVLSCTATRYF